MSKFVLCGEMIEVGTLEQPSPMQSGFVLRLGDGRCVTVLGLTEAEAIQAAKFICADYFITFGG